MKAAALSVAVLACVIVQPEIAHAQADVLMVRLCQKITDDGARLKCFDAIGTEAAKQTAEIKPDARGWDLKDSKSPIDDSPQVMATILSDDGKSGLVLRCHERRTEALFVNDRMFVYEKGAVLVRINDLPAATASWSASDNHKALFAPNGQAFVKSLPDNGTLFIRATGYSLIIDGSFQLGDVSIARDRISTACRWNAATAPVASAAPAQSKKPGTPKQAEPVPFLPTR